MLPYCWKCRKNKGGTNSSVKNAKKWKKNFLSKCAACDGKNQVLSKSK